MLDQPDALGAPRRGDGLGARLHFGDGGLIGDRASAIAHSTGGAPSRGRKAPEGRRVREAGCHSGE